MCISSENRAGVTAVQPMWIDISLSAISSAILGSPSTPAATASVKALRFANHPLPLLASQFFFASCMTSSLLIR